MASEALPQAEALASQQDDGPPTKERVSDESERTLVPGSINEQDHYTRLILVLVMTSIAFGNFLGGLDFTVVATAIPVITSYFKSLHDIGWYGAGYYMTFCAGQPLAGKLFTLYPKKVLYICYVGVFEVGSLICALAPSSTVLIVGRAISGLGASGMLAGGLVIIATISPLQKRPLLTGIANSSFGAAQIIGPLIGGAFAERVTWRWFFYLNLPIGGMVAGLILFFLHLHKAETEKASTNQKLKSLDFTGFALFAGAIIMLLTALEWGGSRHAWNTSDVIGLFCGFGATLIVFIGWQIYRGDNALIPPRLFEQRTAVLAFAVALVANGGFQCVVYYLPIWFQSVLGASPISSGIRYLPSVISDVLTSIIGGTLVMVLGVYKPFLMLGCALLSIGSGLLTTLYPTINEGRWIGYQILCGCGFSFIVTMPHVAVQSVLPPDLIPIASSTIIFAMTASCAILLAVGQTIFTDRLDHNLSKILTPAEVNYIVSEGASKVQQVIKEKGLNASAVDNAYSAAIIDTFYIPAVAAAVAFFLVCGMKWTNIKQKPGSKADIEKVPSREILEIPKTGVEREPEVVTKRQSIFTKWRKSLI